MVTVQIYTKCFHPAGHSAPENLTARQVSTEPYCSTPRYVSASSFYSALPPLQSAPFSPMRSLDLPRLQCLLICLRYNLRRFLKINQALFPTKCGGSPMQMSSFCELKWLQHFLHQIEAFPATSTLTLLLELRYLAVLAFHFEFIWCISKQCTKSGNEMDENLLLTLNLTTHIAFRETISKNN